MSPEVVEDEVGYQIAGQIERCQTQAVQTVEHEIVDLQLIMFPKVIADLERQGEFDLEEKSDSKELDSEDFDLLVSD